MITNRALFIQNLIESKKYNKYLEIGLSQNPNAPYRIITNIETKHSVDMNPKTNADFVADSNTFFNMLDSGSFSLLEKDYKWDIIFIDGCHLAEQVYLDLCNSFNHLQDGGIILMHDALPWAYDMTIEEDVLNRQATCQDVWKVIEYCLKEREDMHVCTLEENEGGLAIIVKSTEKRPMLSKEYNKFYQYGIYAKERNKNMNTIKESEVLNWLEKPYYNFYK